MARLQEATAALSSALTAEEVAEAILGHAYELTGAMACVAYHLPREGEELVLIGSRGLPGEVLERLRRLSLDTPLPLSDAVREQRPFWISGQEELLKRYPNLPSEAVHVVGLRAVAALPLVVGVRTLGGLALGFGAPRAFEKEEREFLQTLARLMAQALERVRLFAAEVSARRRAEALQERASFLAEASQLLARSLDYQATLHTVGSLAVPQIADWFAVELLTEDGSVELVAVTHSDPKKVELARELRRRYPPSPGDAHGVMYVVRTGLPDLMSDLSEEILIASARDEGELSLLRALAFRSYMVVPLIARERALGALTFVTGESARRYGREDLYFAEELARVAALAIDNARLYTEAREAARARDDFLLLASHELNTPLTPLLLTLERLERQAQSTPAFPASAARTIQTATEQMGRVSRAAGYLCDVAQLISGKLELSPEMVDLGEVVREVVLGQREQLSHVGCEVRLDLTPGLVGRWDRGRLVQITNHLLSNAARYGAGAPIEVKVRKEDGVATLSIRDHGVGIPPEGRARVFERFERLVSAQQYAGFGLGLWITRQLVLALGGSIELVSAAGEGATFIVTLPSMP